MKNSARAVLVSLAFSILLWGCSAVEKVKEKAGKTYGGSPWAVEVHSDAKQIYWLRSHWDDADSQVLYRSSYDGENTEVIVGPSSPSEEVDVLDFALDRERERLYWSTDDGEIKRAALDGSNAVTIYDEAPHPTRIALDVENGTLYWMTTQNPPSYYQTQLTSTAAQSESGLLQRAPVDLEADGAADVVGTAGTITRLKRGQGIHLQILLGMLALETDPHSEGAFFADDDGGDRWTYHLTPSGDRTRVFDADEATGWGDVGEVVNRVGFAVHPAQKVMYHTQAQENRIVRLRYDDGGEAPSSVVRALQPTDVAVDTVNRTLYWTEAGDVTIGDADLKRPGGVYRANLDGSGRELVVADSLVADAIPE